MVTRRRVLAGVGVLAVGGLSAAWTTGRRPAAVTGVVAFPASLAPDLGALVRVGAIYAADTPEDAAHVDRLTTELPQDPASAQRRIAADFTMGDVVAVDGWVLARTEARLALVAWSTRQPPWPADTTARRRRAAPAESGTGPGS